MTLKTPNSPEQTTCAVCGKRFAASDLQIWRDIRPGVSTLITASHPDWAIGGSICGEDFLEGGRTLASLGLGHLDRDELQVLLREGFVA